MLSQILCVLPLLATVAAGPHQQGPRSARHARHVEQMATRSNASPVPIFNNALLQSRAQIVSDVARRDTTGQPEFVMEKRNKDGKRVRVMRRKVQACKAADGTTSQIGHELIGAGGSAGATATASVTAAPAPSASGDDAGAEEAYSSAVASISSLHSAAGYPTDWAGPSATSAGATASASSAWSESAPTASVTASPSASSSAYSSEAPAPSSSSGSDSGSSMLFPVGRGIAAWSTEDGMSRKSR